MSDIIDITIQETTNVVEITVEPNIIEVNVIQNGGGAGGSQTLAETLELGNQTGGTNIFVNNADAILLENNASIKKGTYNFGQNGGISRFCSVDYEDMWQGGIRHVFDNNGFIRNSTNGFNTIPNSSFDVTLRFKIGSIWTLDDGTNYICTDNTEGNAVWEIYNSISNLVPYTGANDDVNIGSNDFYTKKIFLLDEVNNNYSSIHYADGDLHIEDADGHKLLVIEDGFLQLHLSDTVQSNLFTTLLTQTRDHYLPNNSGTLALTSDITGTNSGTNTGDETATTIKSKLGITTLSGSNTGDETLATIKSKLGITTLSGSNTGDETSASILSKLGYTPIKSIVKDTTASSAVTGNTTEQPIGTYLIPANTFSANDIMKITSFIAEKTGITGTVTMRVKVGTTATFNSATTIATFTTTVTDLWCAMQRWGFTLRSNTIRGFLSTSSRNTDITSSASAISANTFNPTVDNYIFTSLQLSIATDSVIQSNFIVTN
jgi:hypothetical protein